MPRLLIDCSSSTTSAASWRLQGLLQYFALVEGCLALIRGAEAAAAPEEDPTEGVRGRKPTPPKPQYEWVVRSRIDGFWHRPPPALQGLRPEGYTVPYGNNWGGLNDRLGIGGRESSEVGLSRLSLLHAMARKGLKEVSYGPPLPFSLPAACVLFAPPLSLSRSCCCTALESIRYWPLAVFFAFYLTSVVLCCASTASQAPSVPLSLGLCPALQCAGDSGDNVRKRLLCLPSTLAAIFRKGLCCAVQPREASSPTRGRRNAVEPRGGAPGQLLVLRALAAAPAYQAGGGRAQLQPQHDVLSVVLGTTQRSQVPALPRLCSCSQGLSRCA